MKSELQKIYESLVEKVTASHIVHCFTYGWEDDEGAHEERPENPEFESLKISYYNWRKAEDVSEISRVLGIIEDAISKSPGKIRQNYCGEDDGEVWIDGYPVGLRATEWCIDSSKQ